jgi:PAS domain S-box-containing protein
MRIRSFIFLVVIGLGLLPLFILVALTLPKTIDRLDRAAELESQAKSHVSFAKLNARIRCLKKSLVRSATLPSAVQALSEGTADSEAVAIVQKVLVRWFTDDTQVHSLCLFDLDARQYLSLSRINGTLQAAMGLHKHHPRAVLLDKVHDMNENEIYVRLVDKLKTLGTDLETDEYDLLMATPVFGHEAKIAGVMVMRIDLSQFLKDYTASFWVTGSGEYLRGCFNDRGSGAAAIDSGGSCNAFAEFPSLKMDLSGDDPVMLKNGHGEKVAWLPIIFNTRDQAIMWVGSRVDESATKQWKFFLLINVIGVIVTMAVVVFLSASWIAARIDRLRRDLLSGLEIIINEEKKVSFDWNGPREIKSLARDLTELADHYSTNCEARKRAQAALLESEDKFRSLTASALDGIILMDHEGNISYWNEAATNIFGFTSEDAINQPIHSLIGLRRPDGDHGLVRLDRVEDNPDMSGTLELIGRHKKGHEIPVELSLSSARINNQWHAIWIVRDISERKKSEERVRKQQQQLLHADKMISLGLLVSGVAHEINNPNSIALLNLSMLARAWESVKPILDEYYEDNGDFTVAGLEYTEMRQQLPRLCSELEESAVRIKQIVMDLKDYARQESSGAMTEVDINEVVRSAIRLTTNVIHKSTNHFTVHYGEDLPPIRGNRQRLIQVVINLVQNSCEALQNQSDAISVQTSYNDENDGVEIVVSDTGSGIAEDVINKVTDPFFTTKRTIGGTGLGLSVSAGIVKEHHGLMSFFSTPGQGTRVVIVLPALEGEEQEE